jgi:hypothetical protein
MSSSEVSSFYIPGMGDVHDGVQAWIGTLDDDPTQLHQDVPVHVGGHHPTTPIPLRRRAVSVAGPTQPYVIHRSVRSEMGGFASPNMGVFDLPFSVPAAAGGTLPQQPAGRSERVTHVETRDFNALHRRGYQSSEDGDTAADDPTPLYSGPRVGATPPPLYSVVDEAGGVRVRVVTREPPPEFGGRAPVGYGSGTPPEVGGRSPSVRSTHRRRVADPRVDVGPDDSVSVVGATNVVRTPELAGSSVSSRSTVSLSESSVDRVARRFATYTLGTGVTHRKQARVVSDDSATSARRAKHHRTDLSRTDRLLVASQLLFGGATAQTTRKGKAVLVRRKDGLASIRE